MATNPIALDPTAFPALQSLDIGNVLSPDGRAHVVDGTTPVVVTNVSNPITDLGNSVVTGIENAVTSRIPKNFGLRVALGLIGVVVIIIVLYRLAGSPAPV